ncbi:hypothetical protein ACQ4M3_07590 [Leptolyngbya sp. AN03gr2]|uniref:hypothetical protein n=1 Tax=unclassified Leptolyngbya TaxID=2650499 RepID=UPI003D31636D
MKPHPYASAQQSSNPKTTLKVFRWITLGITIAIFAGPVTIIPPKLAANSARTARVTFETVGVPTPGILREYQRLSPSDVDLLVEETYRTTLNTSRFFTLWGSLMGFLIFWFVIASPTLAGLKKDYILAEQKKPQLKADSMRDC